ncbi:MAG: lipid-A-disaccharide synthase [Verrucomicrobiae bacterium]|nr:lipid-A-disaccharide synthase [Verrucomicrobiae bacterium]
MKPFAILLVAGDPSGDLAAAELVRALGRAAGPVPPRCFGAGGPAMAAAGVTLHHEMTRHSVIGVEILRRISWFRRALLDLVRLARTEGADAVVGVDYAGFNLRLASAVHEARLQSQGPFRNWRPRIIQYIAPQVWASRPGRARRMERTHDLLLSILPFEKGWFAENAPRLPVTFVGHPIVDRHATAPPPHDGEPATDRPPLLVLLPGSRPGELQRHLPVMLPAARAVAQRTGCRLRMVLPREELRPAAQAMTRDFAEAIIQVGGLDATLREATVALASTGTVTLECAWYGVPTVALYRTSRLTFEIGRRIVTVPHLAMPNLLAGAPIMPEFVQHLATPGALAEALLSLLEAPHRRQVLRGQLRAIARSLGPPGASDRAAAALLALLRGGTPTSGATTR